MAPTPPTLKPAAPHSTHPTDDLGAVDYRANPSAGGITASTDGAAPSYDHPTSSAEHEARPWDDQTWAAYDEKTDAARFRGINSPTQQAELHLSPQGPEDAAGFSPDLPAALAWERQGPDGSPPPWQP